MNFAIQKEVLVQCLKEVSSALAGRSVQPILSHIFIQTLDETTLLFKATDLDLLIESKGSAVVYTPGLVSLPGKKLLEIVSKFADDLVTFKTNKDTFETSIQCGRTKISLAGMSGEDFPNLGGSLTDGVLMPADIVRRSIAQTAFAAAGFDTGSVIGGVYIAINDGQFECVATDGNRLAYKSNTLNVSTCFPNNSAKTSTSIDDKSKQSSKGEVSIATLEKPISFKAIVPARASNEVIMIIDALYNRSKRGNQEEGNDSTRDIRLSINNGVISFQTDTNVLSSRIISGEFPAFKELFPSQYKYIATFDREELIASLDRASVMADEKKHLIRLHFESDLMQITANTPDFGGAQDEVPMKFEGQVLDVAVNARYLIDVLRCLNSHQIQIEMTGTLQPLIVKEVGSESYKYLLMPVQLKTGE